MLSFSFFSFFIGTIFGAISTVLVVLLVVRGKFIFKSFSVGLVQFRDISNALEIERRRIGSDIHDELVMSLMEIKVVLEVIMTEVSHLAPKSAQKLYDIIQKFPKISVTIRNIVYGLMPPALEKGDFQGAIKGLCSRSNAFKGAKVNFGISGNPSFISLEMQVQVYRIVQELLNNIVKHASAWNIDVSIVWSDWSLKIVVSDDGIGLSRQKERNKGNGLSLIECRVREIGANLKCSSREHGGTEFELVVPLIGI